jgi:hypothetical protein
MGAHDLLADGEPQARAPGLPPLDLDELLENPRQVFLRNARTIIADTEVSMRPDPFGREPMPAEQDLLVQSHEVSLPLRRDIREPGAIPAPQYSLCYFSRLAL